MKRAAFLIVAALVGCAEQPPSVSPSLQAGEALNARRAIPKN